MIDLQARLHSETLGLKQTVEVMDNILGAAANRPLRYPEMLGMDGVFPAGRVVFRVKLVEKSGQQPISE